MKLNGIKTYFGGKGASGVHQKIINQIPPHDVYIELFLGAGYVMRHKKPTKANIGIEIDAAVVEVWNQSNINHLQVINSDAFRFLHSMITSSIKPIDDSQIKSVILNARYHTTIIYVDPPYPISSRQNKVSVYKHELTDEQHEDLLDILLHIGKCFPNIKIIVSTYPNDLYESLLKNWRKIEFKAKTRRGTATEVLYMNYEEPTELHDYSFLGNDFRERERIKSKINRHVDRLKQIPILERKAILTAIAADNTINEDVRS